MKIEDAIKQQSFESPQQKVIINLVYTYNWLTDKMNDTFKNFEITQQQFNVLRILKGKYPGALSAGEIKEVMLDKNPDLTRLCDRLIEKCLIEREFNEANRRQVLIKITKKGIELLKEIDPEMKKKWKLLDKLSEKEAATLSDLLDKLRS